MNPRLPVKMAKYVCFFAREKFHSYIGKEA